MRVKTLTLAALFGLPLPAFAQIDPAALRDAALKDEIAWDITEGLTTEIGPLEKFYYAEDYHQQYLAKNPGGYCGLRGTGVSCNID